MGARLRGRSALGYERPWSMSLCFGIRATHLAPELGSRAWLHPFPDWAAFDLAPTARGAAAVHGVAPLAAALAVRLERRCLLRRRDSEPREGSP